MTCPTPPTRPPARFTRFSTVRCFTVIAAVALSALSATAAAQNQPVSLRGFLAALEGHPELRAAQATVRAAELQLSAARDPVALETSGGYTRLALDDELLGVTQLPPGGDPDGGLTGSPPETSWQVSAALTFRPYPFGDVADLVAQRGLELGTSRLELRAARAALERRALEAALQLRLAERSTELADEGVDAARKSLEATRLRRERGAANARELRDAEAALLEARGQQEDAALDVALARRNLATLVGDTPPPSYRALAGLALPTPRTPVGVAQLELQTQGVDLALGAAWREIYPVATASYIWNASDTGTLTASLESRTLQPSVGFSYREPARTLPESAVRGTLQLGVSATISVGALGALGAVEAQQQAAAASLAAAREGGTLQEQALRGAFTQAQRGAELNRLDFDNARLTYQENLTREELGLSAPLETQAALLELLQSDLGRRSAELERLGALLDLYDLYALPPSETLP